jgi:SWIM zinc finger
MLILDSTDVRIMRSNEIAVEKISEDIYEALSSEDPQKRYVILYVPGSGWTCNCLDAYYRGVKCKHTLAVKQVEALR